MRSLLLIAGITCTTFVVMGQAAPPQYSYDYKVVYTGRLLGQFRYPEFQSARKLTCKAQAPAPGLLARKFSDALEEVDPQHQSIRVAVGDSFAPFFLSRLMWNDLNDPGERWLHKEQYEFSPSTGAWVFNNDDKKFPAGDEMKLLTGEGVVPSDNVGCFLRLAQFDVIVPGSFDFYFGPERLRELKRFIESPESSFYHRVRLLGSNLTMAPVHVGPNDPPNAAGGSKSATGNPPDAAAAMPEAVLPSVVLPWMRAVRVKNAITISPAPVNPAAMDDLFNDPDSKCFLQWLGVLPPSGSCSGGSLQLTGSDRRTYTFSKNYSGVAISSLQKGGIAMLSPAAKSKIGPDIDFWISGSVTEKQQRLPIGRLTLTIATANGQANSTSFNVELPFLEFIDQKPWELPESTGGKVAVFVGVVDQNMGAMVGRLNTTWMSKNSPAAKFDKSTETDLHFSDPAEALAQVIQYCGEFEECREARKVMLASMSQSAIYNLLAELRSDQILPPDKVRLDMVIGEADPSHKTGDRVINYPNERNPSSTLVPVLVLNCINTLMY